MAVNGVTYSNQKVSAADHGALFRLLVSDGVLSGCGVSYRYDTVTFSAGAFVICGRLTKIVGSESITISGSHPDGGYIRIRGVADMTAVATPTSFEQFRLEWSPTRDFATTADGFDELITDNINTNWQIYEIEFAVLRIDSSNAFTGVVRKIGRAHV